MSAGIVPNCDDRLGHYQGFSEAKKELFIKNCVLISNYIDESTRRKLLSCMICWLKLQKQLLAVVVFSVSCVSVNQVENLSFNTFCPKNFLWTLIITTGTVLAVLCYSSDSSPWRHKYPPPWQYLVIYSIVVVHKMQTIVEGTERSDLKTKNATSPS